jgi:uncharacterized protein YdiU (UPF0061 family)
MDEQCCAPLFANIFVPLKDFLTLDIQFLKKNSHPAWQNLGGYCPSFIASVYAGHQFGHFAGQLGDGRSCLIGQMSHNPPLQGQIHSHEFSLKGAGKTPYSRGADGRAVLRSSIREYLCSIAMQGANRQAFWRCV